MDGESFPVYSIHLVADIDEPTPGSIAAMCDTAKFTRNVEEYENTRQLVIDQICNTLG